MFRGVVHCTTSVSRDLQAPHEIILDPISSMIHIVFTTPKHYLKRSCNFYPLSTCSSIRGFTIPNQLLCIHPLTVCASRHAASEQALVLLTAGMASESYYHSKAVLSTVTATGRIIMSDYASLCSISNAILSERHVLVTCCACAIHALRQQDAKAIPLRN